jgi:hippurate hydrolase
VATIVKPQDLVEEARFAAEVRHQIHRFPEVGLDLPITEKFIVETLKAMGVEEVYSRVGGENVGGVVAVIRGNRPGRTIGLRGDSDALPLNENTGAPYTSQHTKCHHACGHDGHVACVMAAVKYLHEHRDFAGTMVAIFQPGEEGFAGARYMLEDGLIERFGIDEFYALHAEPSVPVGHVAFVPGYATANADIFEIVFEGKGGHGSRPQFVHDPIVAASECVLALQTIVSRSAPADMAAVVSVGCVEAGDRNGTSVVPQFATLRGTARSFEPEIQELIIQRMKRIAEGIAHAHEMKAEAKYTKLYPAMYNDPTMVENAKALASEALGEACVEAFRRTPGGEDFSFMLREKPGCLFRLGMKDETHTVSVHNERFDFNDKAIATGVAVLLTIALDRMAA